MWATGSRHRHVWATAVSLAVLGAVLAILWQYPEAELVVFHAVWIGLAIITLRAPSPPLHSWMLVSFVTVLATVIEIDDVREGHEGSEILVLLVIDLIAFIILVWLADQHRRAIAFERNAAIVEQDRSARQRAFFANASHALRTPITVARGHAEMALHDTAKPAVKLDVMVVLDELDRLTRATDRILKLSVAGEIDGRRQHTVDVDDLVTSTIGRWRPTARRTWVAELGSGGAEVLGHLEDLTEALDALVDNAVQATDPDGSINVRSQLEGETVVLSVTDDGAGIGDADPEHLFDPFQQGPRTRQSQGGTGLGLAIVRAIAQAHDGDATMESTAGATTVRITLPRLAKRPAPSNNGPTPVTTTL